ncbi:MAG: 2-C-methyl-D-erythritol 4-phosphate cytidylyltransferase [Casimicrobium sp.]
MNERLHTVAIVPAGGSGARFGANVPKQYLEIAGKTVLEYSLNALLAVDEIQRVYLTIQYDDAHGEAIVARMASNRVETLRCAGVTRAETVTNALDAIRARVTRDARVLVHDAARPCVSREAIERLLSETRGHDAGGLLALPMADTIKRADSRGEYLETVSRDGLWRAQTPQLFPYDTLVYALRASPDVTDEAQAIEALGLKPKLVLGEARNIKITYPEDLALAKFFLENL